MAEILHKSGSSRDKALKIVGYPSVEAGASQWLN